MAKTWKSLGAMLCLTIGIFNFSCDVHEDPGPIQRGEETFPLVDFDRLEIGDALIIDVEQSNFFSISAKGDRRNLNDLEVFKDGGTLVVRFDENSNRKHETHITITMPMLKSVNFSGASYSTVSGFDTDDKFDIYLSGASISQVDITSAQMNAVVSGASILTLQGQGNTLNVEISGASELNAFNFEVVEAEVDASGASKARVFADDTLTAKASGASLILYRGNPDVTSSTSGASSVAAD